MKITKRALKELIKRVYKEETEYQTFFNKALSKFGVKSPAELEGEKKEKFFNYVDSNWKGDVETD